MPNPWDKPSSAPNRRGDADANALYRSVGRALSAWEGLEADLGSVCAALTLAPSQRYAAPAIRAFGTVNNTGSRAEMITHAAEAFFHLASSSVRDDVDVLMTELKEILKHYRGWAARRNDIAHGYVTESRHPDYTRDDQPIITTYTLCPSHGNSKKWMLHMEPIYNYIAFEIDVFAEAFDKLAPRIAEFAQRLDKFRSVAFTSSESE
jgi:hypothetical protein